MKNATLVINDLRLWVYLGHTAEERANQQVVRVDIKISFLRPPKALSSDKLADTYCYTNAINNTTKLVTTEKFALIEHLTNRIHESIAADLNQHGFEDAALAVTVIKLSPPVPNVHGGVSFTIF